MELTAFSPQRGVLTVPRSPRHGPESPWPHGSLPPPSVSPVSVPRILEERPSSSPAATRCWRHRRAAAGSCTSLGCPQAEPDSSSALYTFCKSPERVFGPHTQLCGFSQSPASLSTAAGSAQLPGQTGLASSACLA